MIRIGYLFDGSESVGNIEYHRCRAVLMFCFVLQRNRSKQSQFTKLLRHKIPVSICMSIQQGQNNEMKQTQMMLGMHIHNNTKLNISKPYQFH